MEHAEIYERLRPLRGLEASPSAAARVVSLAARPAPVTSRRRGRHPRMAATLAGACAIAAAFAVMPSGREPSVLQQLHATAAVAAEQPHQAYRFVEWRNRWTAAVGDTGRQAERTIEEHGEQWVDARWHGTRRVISTRVLAEHGDPGLLARLPRQLQPVGDRPYPYGDGPLARVPLDRLPVEAAALEDLLTAAYQDRRWATHPGAGAGRSAEPDGFATMVVTLLTDANARPQLRAALYELLAGLPGVRDLGRIEDPQGRTGTGIEVRFAAAGDRPAGAPLQLVFDPDTSEVLAWQLGAAGDHASPSDPERFWTGREVHVLVRQGPAAADAAGR